MVFWKMVMVGIIRMTATAQVEEASTACYLWHRATNLKEIYKILSGFLNRILFWDKRVNGSITKIKFSEQTCQKFQVQNSNFEKASLRNFSYPDDCFDSNFKNHIAIFICNFTV